MSTTFNQFKLSPAVLDGVAALGFTVPTPVQSHAIPLVLAGRDAILQAKTGSGKTLAFGLPILSLLKPQHKPQALVILPTRELAIQVCEALASVSGESPLKTVAIYGGVGLGPQETALRKGVDIVVGTPGRLKDLINRGSLDLSQVHILVLDEADVMLDMGFRRDIEFLLNRLPGRKQTLILSATMPSEIETIAHKHLKDPAVVKLVQQDERTPSTITHYFLELQNEQRLDALVAVLQQEDPERAIIFTRMKHETKRLAEKLRKRAGIEAGFLNGNMSQNARNTMLARFRSGEVKYLIATDVAARGLDVEALSHVIHFAVPTVVETYIHRSGRTGRAGNDGMTITFVTPDAEGDFKAIRKQISVKPYPEKLSLPAVSIDEPLDERPARQPQGRGDRQPRQQRPRQAEAQPTQRRQENQRGQRRAEEPSGEARPQNQSRGGERRSQAQQAHGWRKFKMPLPAGHRQNRESYHRWLVDHTGVARGEFRSITINADHATFEVAGSSAERMLQQLKLVKR